MSAKCYWQGALYLKQCVLSSYHLPFWWSYCLTQHAHVYLVYECYVSLIDPPFLCSG